MIMALADLYSVPTSPESLATWSFAHAAHHRDINAAVQRRLGVLLPEYVLDPIPVGDPGWADGHYDMHLQMNAALGLQGFDLTEIDWKDEEQFAAWVHANAIEHSQAGTILGVG